MTKKYRLDFGNTRPIIDRLPGYIRQRVKQTILALVDNPRPKGTKALTGDLAGYYRITLEQYRIIYLIHEEIVTIIIVRVAKRDNDTYKGLPTID